MDIRKTIDPEFKNLVLLSQDNKVLDKETEEKLNKWLKRFEDVRRFGNVKKSTLKQDIKRLKVFINFCLERLKKEPDKLEFEDFISFFNYLENERKIKINTQDKYFKLLSVFYRILYLRNLEEFRKFKDYCKEMGKFRRYEIEHYDELTREEVNLILKEILNSRSLTKGRDALIVRVTHDTGARIDEVLSLKIKDIDWKNGIVKFKDTKTREEREAVIGLDTLEALKKYKELWLIDRSDDAYLFQNKDGKKVAYEWIHKVFMKAVKKLQNEEKIPKSKKIGIHSLRHSRIVELLDSGYPIEIVSDYVGHKDVKTTLIYAHRRKRKLLMLKRIQKSVTRGQNKK